MKQLLQRLDTGETTLVDVPVPSASGHRLLVETRATLISAGTERMLVDFGRANLLEKARKQPDKVRQVLDKMKTEGVATTLDAVRSKLGPPSRSATARPASSSRPDREPTGSPSGTAWSRTGPTPSTSGCPTPSRPASPTA